MEHEMNISIALLGNVSVGKSTLLNSLFEKSLIDMGINNTKFAPKVYTSGYNKNEYLKIEEIIKDNKKKTDEMLLQTKDGTEFPNKNIQEINYKIQKGIIFKGLKSKVPVRFYDIPGLNNYDTTDKYFSYVDNNFHKFDIVIFMIDIQFGLSTVSEMKILNRILKGINENKMNYGINTDLIILINKCDNMFINNNNYITMKDNIYNKFNKIKNKIKSIIPELKFNIIAIATENMFMHRLLKKKPSNDFYEKYGEKIGRDEFGNLSFTCKSKEDNKNMVMNLLKNKEFCANILKLTGYNKLANIINKHLTEEKQCKYSGNFIKYTINEIDNKIGINDRLEKIKMCYTKINDLKEKYKGHYDKTIDEIFNSSVNPVKEWLEILFKTIDKDNIDYYTYIANFEKIFEYNKLLTKKNNITELLTTSVKEVTKFYIDGVLKKMVINYRIDNIKQIYKDIKNIENRLKGINININLMTYFNNSIAKIITNIIIKYNAKKIEITPTSYNRFNNTVNNIKPFIDNFDISNKTIEYYKNINKSLTKYCEEYIEKEDTPVDKVMDMLICLKKLEYNNFEKIIYTFIEKNIELCKSDSTIIKDIIELLEKDYKLNTQNLQNVMCKLFGKIYRNEKYKKTGCVEIVYDFWKSIPFNEDTEDTKYIKYIKYLTSANYRTTNINESIFSENDFNNNVYNDSLEQYFLDILNRNNKQKKTKLNKIVKKI